LTWWALLASRFGACTQTYFDSTSVAKGKQIRVLFLIVLAGCFYQAWVDERGWTQFVVEYSHRQRKSGMERRQCLISGLPTHACAAMHMLVYLQLIDEFPFTYCMNVCRCMGQANEAIHCRN
jgi:hypothetical protein